MIEPALNQLATPEETSRPVVARFDPLFGAISGDGWFPSPAHILRRAAILDSFAAYPAGSLLEMGCGAGRMLVDWDRLGHSGQACDLDAGARRLAANCCAKFGAKFEVREAPSAGGFDYLVATEVLEHLEDPARILGEWLTFLRPGGIALLTVPAFQSKWGASDDWAGHVQRFEPAAFRGMIENLGLTIVEQRLHGFPVGDCIRVAGNVASARRIRSRPQAIDRQQATFASGRDRTVENSLAPFLQSPPARAVLRAGIALQRRFNRGNGMLVLARK